MHLNSVSKFLLLRFQYQRLVCETRCTYLTEPNRKFQPDRSKIAAMDSILFPSHPFGMEGKFPFLFPRTPVLPALFDAELDRRRIKRQLDMSRATIISHNYNWTESTKGFIIKTGS